MTTSQIGRSSTTRRQLAAAAAGMATAGLVLAACSSSGGPAADRVLHGTPHQIVLAAVDATESADSAAIDISISVKGTPSFGGLGGLGGASTGSSSSADRPIDVTISGHGMFSFAQKTGDMTVDVPSLGTSPATSIEVRRIGQDIYLKSPKLSQVAGGKTWVHVNLSQYLQSQGQSQSGSPLGGLSQGLSDGDPTEILALLKQLGAQVTEVGPGQVDGVATIEYQGVLDLSGGTTGSTLISPQIAQGFGLTSIPVDVWVDGQGRARRVSTSLSIFGITIKAQEQLGSFGTPVSVSAPPADQVADGSGLLQGGQLGNLLGGTSG
ncbi:MAG: hypothetical protein KGJ77_01575 [Acidobacteriota bacterium]|nr:hypothetical protein [Acidobacteriota bacterium]